MAPATARLTPLDRFLRLFSDVQQGEGLTAVLLSANVFIILTAYYVLKPVREALILGQGSAELKSYMSAGMVGVLALAVPLYGRLARRWPRRRLINVTTAFFAACLVVFYVLAKAGFQQLGMIYFVWIGVFSLMIVAQFWAFANDVYTEDEGKRLFPIIGFGASLGAVLGAGIAGRLIVPLGVEQLMLVGGALLIAEVALTNYVETRERARTTERDQERGNKEPVSNRSDGGAFGMVRRTPYLLLIGLMLMCLNWVNTTGEYILGSVVEHTARDAVATGMAGGLSVEQYIGRFYSDFFAVVNVAGVFIQLFLVSRIIKYLGVKTGVMMLPVISMGAYGLLAFYPLLGAVRWAKTAENATDYSLNNTVRNMLFLTCTHEQKYSAKQVVDAFFVRIGDVLSAMLVFVGTTYFALEASGFAIFNLFVVGTWLTLAYVIGREYMQLAATGQPPGDKLISGVSAERPGAMGVEAT